MLGDKYVERCDVYVDDERYPTRRAFPYRMLGDKYVERCDLYVDH